MKKILFPELNSILDVYFNSKNTFELAEIIDKENISDIPSKTDNALIICDDLDIELVKNFGVLQKFQKIYFEIILMKKKISYNQRKSSLNLTSYIPAANLSGTNNSIINNSTISVIKQIISVFV